MSIDGLMPLLSNRIKEQLNQTYSRKIQIDNIVIMNTFRKAMSLLSY